MTKLLENTFRSINIGLVNEVAIMCKYLGVDVWEVIEAASTKPFGYTPCYPGPGLGGHCIPIDPLYLSWKLKTLNYKARFIELADEVNTSMPEHVLALICDALNTKKKSINLPVEAVDLEFITQVPIILSQEEQDELNAKICTEILSDYQTVHYYLMRIFGKDNKGATYLCSPSFMTLGGPKSFLSEHATFLKNTIEEYTDEKGRMSYLCESLVETENKHFLVMTELEISHGKISMATRRSILELSIYEASMMLRRWEYVLVYEILDDPDNFDVQFTNYTLGAMRTEHSNGEMFMEFNRDNAHVNQRVFNLSDDIACLYYVTDFGQLILGAYSLDTVTQMAERLQKSALSSMVFPTSKYQFQEPVLYEFAQSEFEEFEEFLKSLS
jgi:hypothetical protein